MPKTTKLPSYRKHKPTGQAVVTIDGKDFYLGKYGTRSSRREHNRLMLEWLAGGRRLPSRDVSDITITEHIVAYWKYAKSYYVRNGKPHGMAWDIVTKPLTH